MREKYAKKITATEASKFFIRIGSDGKSLFPGPEVPFKIATFLMLAQGKAFDVHLDKLGRIWYRPIFHALRLREGDEIAISRNPNGVFLVEKTRMTPERVAA